MSAPENVVPISTPDSSSSRGGGDYGERLARIEAKLENMATRENLARIETSIAQREASMQRWLLGIIAMAAISLVVALIRTFS